MIDRILDANFNRFSEGIRVIEDVARFVLEDAELAGRLKKLRHGAGQLKAEFGGELLAARDSIADPGRAEIMEPGKREGVLEILGASFGRVQEALRVIEEMAKLSSPKAAARAKAMRYEAYELERRIVPLFDRNAKLTLMRGLYLVMSDPLIGYEKLAEIAVELKVGAIQLRDKNLESGPLLAIAKRLKKITRNSNTLLFINDRADIAKLAEADGIHVGQHDLSVAEGREIVGERMLIGKSTHNLGQLESALKENPDYIAIGPVFGTQSKERPDKTVGLGMARRMLNKAGEKPAVAIGGIGSANLESILNCDFRSYALIAEVSRADDPRAAIKRLQALEKAAATGRRP